MANTKQVNDPDTQINTVGKNAAFVYIVDPTTNLAVPAGGSETSGDIVEQAPSYSTRQGHVFSVALQKTSVATGLCAVSVFNPNASGKTLYVFVAKVIESTSNYHFVYAATVDPNYSGTNKGALTAANQLLGSATASVANCTYSNTGAETATGTLIDLTANPSVQQGNFLETGTGALYVVPPNHGVVMYVNTATNNWAAAFKWYEL